MSASKKDKVLTNNEVGLQAVRAEINALDHVILHAIEDRAALAAKMSTVKSGPLKFRPGREADLIRNLIKNTSLPAELVEQIWRSIIAHNLISQTGLKIARLDIEAIAAATQFRFSTNYEAVLCTQADEVVDTVARGDAQLGVVPDWQNDGSWLGVLKTHRQNGLNVCISAYTHMLANQGFQPAVVISTILPDPSSADMTVVMDDTDIKMIEGYHPDMVGIVGIIQLCDIS
jgi:chorismate mutase